MGPQLKLSEVLREILPGLSSLHCTFPEELFGNNDMFEKIVSEIEQKKYSVELSKLHSTCPEERCGGKEFEKEI